MPEGGSAGALVDLMDRRSTILDHLADGPATVADLARATPDSRSTVARGLGDLEAAGIVETIDSEHRLTLYGRLVYGHYVELSTAITTVSNVADRLATLPADTTLPPVVVRQGRPLEDVDACLANMLGDADSIRLDLAAHPPGLSAYLDGVGTATVRAVLTAPAIRGLATAGTFDRDRLDIYLRETDEPLPFTLLLAGEGNDETIAVCTHADGRIDWGLEVSDADALAWGREVFARRWRLGTPVPVPG